MRRPAPTSQPAAARAPATSLPPLPMFGNQATIAGLQSPFPTLSHAQLQAVLAESERPIREWLQANQSRLFGLSLNAIVAEVYRNVPAASGQGRGTIEALVREWASAHGISLPPQSLIPRPEDAAIPPAPAGPSLADSSIVSSVKGAVQTIVDGVGIERSHGYAKITVSGPTVGLRGHGLEASGTVSWSGGLSVETSYRGVHFSGSLAPDKWEMSLTFPAASSVPDLTRLGEVFGKGERAMRGILSETASFETLDDIPAVAEAVSPHLDPVKAAVWAAQGIAEAKPGVSFGVAASGPGPSPNAPPMGASVLGVVTIRF
jgi:hypothetical protein